MKKALLSFGILLFMTTVAGAQGRAVTGGPEITFEKTVHDFGTVMQHEDAIYEFKYTNTGNEPLVLTNVRGSCSCTVPSWPKEPLLPGKSNTIKVKYDSKRVGPINKSVNISSNATGSFTKIIRIKGTVKAAPKEEDNTLSPVKPASAGAPVAN